MQSNDFVTANATLEKTASLDLRDTRTLSALAFVQSKLCKYRESLQTAQRVHAIGDHGMANVHYIAAIAARALHDASTTINELRTLLSEDPTNQLAPTVRTLLAAAAQPTPHYNNSIYEDSPPQFGPGTFPNSHRLRAELDLVSNSKDEDDLARTDNHESSADLTEKLPSHHDPDPSPVYATWDRTFTIHKAVNETTLSVGVSQHGQAVDDLSLSDLQIRDDGKPFAEILDFLPQSKVPLCLGVLIDISDSIGERAAFAKKAAKKFLSTLLNTNQDLGFVAAFNSDVSVTGDFSRDSAQLSESIDNLPNGGDGTSVFDAINFGCLKLAECPDSDRAGKQMPTKLCRLSPIEAAENLSSYNAYLSWAGMPTNLPKIFAARYLIAYKPADFLANGKYRSIKVRAIKAGKRFHVRTRKGYYARAEMLP